MSVNIKLKKPITAHGEEVSELTFREPTPDDIMQIGAPQLLIPSADGESLGIEVRAKVVGQYISRLSAIPMGSVKAMSIGDFQRCTGAVMGFFTDGDD